MNKMTERAMLTIDFDYFCREKVIWDWGHSEAGERLGIFVKTIWPIRYMNLKLYEETDLSYADFKPYELWMKLRERGIKVGKHTRLGVAESHEMAYKFFLDTIDDVAVIYNFDAHHDLYSTHALDCGNWAYHLAKEVKKRTGEKLKVVWVYPQWVGIEWFDKLPIDDVKLPRGVKRYVDFEYMTYDDIPKKQRRVDDLFVCRSGAWVPPHHDQAFLDMLGMGLNFWNLPHDKVADYGIIQRKAMSREQAEELYESYQKKISISRAHTSSSGDGSTSSIDSGST